MTDADDTYGDEALAAEFVLRLLDPEEERAFVARLATDQALRDLVHKWERDLAEMAGAVPAIAPPARLRRNVIDAAGAGNAQSGAPRRFWRWGAFGGLAVAAVVALVIAVGPLLDTAPRPEFQAELSTGDRSVVLTASVIPATHEIVVEPLVGTPPEGRVFELWLIAEGADTPVSLGVLNRLETTRIRVPDEIAPGVRTGTVAISDEPPGGSATGAPTGAILATATFSDI